MRLNLVVFVFCMYKRNSASDCDVHTNKVSILPSIHRSLVLGTWKKCVLKSVSAQRVPYAGHQNQQDYTLFLKQVKFNVCSIRVISFLSVKE